MNSPLQPFSAVAHVFGTAHASSWCCHPHTAYASEAGPPCQQSLYGICPEAAYSFVQFDSVNVAASQAATYNMDILMVV